MPCNCCLFLLKNLYWIESGKLAWRFNLSVINDNIDMVGVGLKNINIFSKPTLFVRGEKSNYVLDSDFEEIKKKVSLQTDTEIVEKFDMLYAFPKSHVPFVENLIGIKLKKLGVCLGEMKGKNFVPHHELALSVSSASKFPSRELTLQQALQFLKKQDFFFDSDSRGFILLTHKGLGLGWVKHLGSRINNYLPASSRILMEIPSEFSESDLWWNN